MGDNLDDMKFGIGVFPLSKLLQGNMKLNIRRYSPGCVTSPLKGLPCMWFCCYFDTHKNIFFENLYFSVANILLHQNLLKRVVKLIEEILIDVSHDELLCPKIIGIKNIKVLAFFVCWDT